MWFNVLSSPRVLERWTLRIVIKRPYVRLSIEYENFSLYGKSRWLNPGISAIELNWYPL